MARYFSQGSSNASKIQNTSFMTFGRTKPLVIGISGATCSGKTTLSKLLQATFPWATVIHQDSYFFPNEPEYHVYVPGIGYNWELESALDFARMEEDVRHLLSGRTMFPRGAVFFDNEEFVFSHAPSQTEKENLKLVHSSVPIIIIEGHIIFNRQFFNEICHQKYFLTQEKDECFRRRQARVYNPMPPVHFFERFVWPSYETRLKEVRRKEGIIFVDAQANELVDIYAKMKASAISAMSKTGFYFRN